MPAVEGPRTSAEKVKKPIPEKETVVESKDNRVIFDGVRGRLEDHHPMWNADTGELMQFASTSTTQGTAAKTYIGQPGAGEKKESMGAIERTGDFGRIKHEILLPFTLFCRPLAPQFCPSPLTDFETTGKQEAVNGVVCEVFQSKETGQQHREIWLDPKREYIPVRYRHIIKGNVGMTADIEYQQHPDIGWVLKSWKVSQFGHGALQSLFRASTIRIDSFVVGTKYSAEQFDFSFPPNARVYDDRDKKMYMVLPNGDLQEQQRDGTLTGPSISQGGWWQQYRWGIAIGIGLIGLGTWIAIRHKKKQD